MFCGYTTTLDNPWEITNSIKHAQKLWNTFVPQLKHTIFHKNDSVFYLPSEVVDEHGGYYFIPLHYPYMWEEFDYADPENLVCNGSSV
ncbi:hypothetical protein PAXRUDRAFT_36588 [Paxillus rubicundulus Ve08.2h10]|uniref:Uncharacterized protein n=1 Tax=Paxillus rubicundulus Ve08.2h10 TaxID=930991 RepID=A0A0D0C6B9_9AGAM|nr:hypothetical protein PAXRUDRAFT_36588 [Paxillus rubicundulus Ve08.2h10]